MLIPAYISYTNEAFGGPANSYKYVSDSSSEWGQQLNAVRRYVDARGIRNCWFAYFNQAMMDFRSFGIPCTPLLTGRVSNPGHTACHRWHRADQRDRSFRV